jgi:replicative DNA helicase
MSTHTNVCRLICQLTGIPYKYVYQGKLTKEQWEQVTEATQRIKESKIYFDEGTMSVTEIRAKLRKLAEKDIKLLVIDQLEQVHGYDGLAPHLQFDKITYDIKSFAKEFNIPIILNHQLNRNVANRKSDSPEPQLTDLNQAGEKAADQVWAIVHRKDEDGKILSSKISMLKNRNGPCVNVPIIFVADRMLFSNPMKQDNNDRGIPNSRSSNQAIPKDDADSFFDTNGE